MKIIKTLGEYHDPAFFFQDLIMRQVEREAWVDWALHPVPEIRQVPPVKKSITIGQEIWHVIFGTVRGAIHP